MKPRKAQLAGQIFIYILTLVIVAAILIFGYQSIRDFTSRTKQVEEVQLQQELDKNINSLTSQFGTLKKVSFRVHDDNKELCFLNNYDFDSSMNMDSVLAEYPLIEDSLDPYPTSNIFLIRDDSTLTQQFRIGLTHVDGNFICFPVSQGRVEFSLEGRGDHVRVS